MKISKSQKAIYVVISVLVAVVFWLYVDNLGANESDIRLYNIPVTFVGENEELAERGLMLSSGGDTTIDLRLQGRRQVISKINKNNVKILVDVRNISTTGIQILDYTISYPSNVSPTSVTVVSASMYKITVEVGELHSKTIQIITDIKGSVADGYMLHECTVSPETLTISGTEEDVERIDHALVEVALNNATTSYSEYLTYNLIDTQGQIVDQSKLRCSEDKVRVEVPVVTLKELPLSVEFMESSGSRETDISYDISPKSITVSGEESTLDKLDEIVVAQIDLSRVLGDDTLEYEIPLPGGCTNESGTDKVRVTIKFKNMQTETYECSNISFANVPDGYSATAITQSVDVTLRGKQTELDKIGSKNIRIVADLGGLSAASGTYTTRAKVYVDGTDDVGAIGAYQIGYRLQKS